MVKTKTRLITLCLALIMLFAAASSFSVFADGNPDDKGAETTVPTETTAPAETTVPTETTAPAETTVATETTASTETAETTVPEGDDGETPEVVKKKLGVGFWVSMAILGVLVIAGIVAAIVKRDRLKSWFKSYKSEIKKIVWSPRAQVRKNTIVVIVMVLALALIIALLDFAFSKGIIALGNIR